MNSLVRFADETTHIKIVAVSLIAAIIVVAIGINGRDFVIGEPTAVTRAAKAVNFSTSRFQGCADKARGPEPHTNAQCREAQS
jgi:hypothetical protein